MLAATDRVIYKAQAHNIRVLNRSLAAGSRESWHTDPLARAARSATAAGMVVVVVVVAAANHCGQLNGATTVGTIGLPGHDPSVSKVGSSHLQ